MTSAEADAKWAAEKKAMLAELLPLPRMEKALLIIQATSYRSGADSCNSIYMGSMAMAQLLRALGGSFGNDYVDSLLAKATEKQIDAALGYCAPYIKAMRESPTQKCPCCGQVTPEKPSYTIEALDQDGWTTIYKGVLLEPTVEAANGSVTLRFKGPATGVFTVPPVRIRKDKTDG